MAEEVHCTVEGKGRQELRPFEFREGGWRIVFDRLLDGAGTKSNQHVFDVARRRDYGAIWRLNLIEHSGRSEDERFGLRSALD